MDLLNHVLQSINDSAFAEAERNSFWVFPAVESIHVVAIVYVVGSITRLDLRLMGLIWRDRPITDVSDEMLPWTWTAFVIALVFGALLWASKPAMYLGIAFFDAKMLLMLLAALNMLAFQYGVFRKVAAWDRDPIPPLPARLAGAASMALWLCVVICGRFIGFV